MKKKFNGMNAILHNKHFGVRGTITNREFSSKRSIYNMHYQGRSQELEMGGAKLWARGLGAA